MRQVKCLFHALTPKVFIKESDILFIAEVFT